MTDVLVIPHSEAAEERAHLLLGDRSGVRIVGRRAALRALVFERPRVAYLVDMASTTAAAAVIARALGVKVIMDTGDVVYELLRSTGTRSRAGLVVVRVAEAATLRLASHVVVRGRHHAELLAPKPTTFAPDLAPPDAGPVEAEGLRAELGLTGTFVVGLVGSLHYAPRLGITYGWDLVDALPHTPPHVRVLIIGDGDGRGALEERARRLGVADRCRFAGRISAPGVYEWVSAMDAAVSTQTADVVGQVRTTGKLPLYLACGCPVLASAVGEAQTLLGPLGWTVEYNGVVDRDYPLRLAAKITAWSSDDGTKRRRAEALAVHRRAFDPIEVRERVWRTVVAVEGRS